MDTRLTYTVEPAAFDPITIDPDKCIGCNRCVEACQVDIFVPSAEPRGIPIVAYPGECWHSGDCVVVCPVPGAIEIHKMPRNLVHWRRPSTGQINQLPPGGIPSRGRK